MSAPRSEWRTRSRKVIHKVLDALPADATEAQSRRAVSAAYPFGERAMHPYKCWLAEVCLALQARFGKAKTDDPPPTVSVHFAHAFCPWWIGVTCQWCNTGPASSGCLVCGQTVDRVRTLANSEGWKQWKAVLLAEPDAHLPASDWLEENGWPELADEARRTWTHITACPTCKGKGKYRKRYGRVAVHGDSEVAMRTCHHCHATGKQLVVEVVSMEVANNG